MKTDIVIPWVGESITSAFLAAWHKADGEQVGEGEALLTVETDKISTEIFAEKSGILHILIPQGEEVAINTTVGTLEESVAVEKEPAPSPHTAPMQRQEPKQSPQSKTPMAAPPATPESTRVTRQKLSPLRRKIAAQLVAARSEAALLTTFNECDMSAVMDLRSRHQERFQSVYGIKLGFMSFFLKATVAALAHVPNLNSRMEGDELVLNHFYDIGVAVGTERGLVVPVLRDVEKKSFWQLEQELADVAQKAREGALHVEEITGGVFTISNGGIYGSLLSTPIVNPPQSGILGLHKIQQRPVARNGAVVVTPMMYLALSYDHRVVDGKEAVTFLVKIKEIIEEPARLFLEI